MNPDPVAAEVHAYYQRIERERVETNRRRLHNEAVARRRKSKRGGKR